MKGCEDAKKFEKDGTSTNIPISDTKRFNYLLSTGITQEEGRSSFLFVSYCPDPIPSAAYTRFRWPYYQKLKHLALQISVPPPPVYPPSQPTYSQPPMSQSQSQAPSGSRPLPLLAHQDNGHDNDQSMDFDDSMNISHNWDGPEHSPSPPLEFSGRGGTSQRPPATAAVASSNPFPVPPTQQPSPLNTPKHETQDARQSAAARAEMLAIERERWELQKQEARQKLELEKEQMRRNERIQEQESHIQLVKMFRGLIADGLTKNQAGRVVWREKWSAIKAEVSCGSCRLVGCSFKLTWFGL
jgi:hypothetical protein